MDSSHLFFVYMIFMYLEKSVNFLFVIHKQYNTLIRNDVVLFCFHIQSSLRHTYQREHDWLTRACRTRPSHY